MATDNIYEYVKNKRKELGVTQKQLSLLLGMKEAGERTVRSWEIGEHKPSETRLKKLQELTASHPFKNDSRNIKSFTFIDLFAGIGGIRLPFQLNGGECVFSSEIDHYAQKTYYSNYGDYPSGDITQIEAKDIPDHDILLAGFPCQAFSQAGLKKGFNDTRGTMFFEIQRILAEKQPKMFLLENVKRLISHDGKKTFITMTDILRGSHNGTIPEDIPISDEARNALSLKLNYWIDFKVLNANDFGSPQNRERIYIVGFNKNYFTRIDDFSEIFQFPEPSKENVKVGDILEKIPQNDTTYTISEKIWEGHQKRKLEHQKKGNGFGYSLFNENSKYTNTISARYYKDGSEALIDQSLIGKPPRMLTPRECARLQGFPDEYIVDAVSKNQAYKQFGNSVCIKVVNAISKKMITAYNKAKIIQAEKN
ncbi:DNA (cytosine-5-)-methyltransferase [Providencia sp. PROV212]|jgi:DNA (cytosine-5)-methyltransferase 1|uniref:DNA (cytosine-5-)-methyltransferase n=1 Tax=Providencia sp. PROV212 TaxID=2949909 RepID=UPI002349EC3A|nr:DNA (cytosine-5-)-methyltransferase [Providencia sp. PROV212]